MQPEDQPPDAAESGIDIDAELRDLFGEPSDTEDAEVGAEPPEPEGHAEQAEQPPGEDGGDAGDE